MMGNNKSLLQSLTFYERMYTPAGLKANAVYQVLLKEAIDRGLRQEILTPEELAIRVEMEGPGMDRDG